MRLFHPFPTHDIFKQLVLCFRQKIIETLDYYKENWKKSEGCLTFHDLLSFIMEVMGSLDQLVIIHTYLSE